MKLFIFQRLFETENHCLGIIPNFARTIVQLANCPISRPDRILFEYYNSHPIVN